MVIFVGIVFLLCVSLKMKISKFNQLTLDDDIIYHTFYSNGEIKEVLVLSLSLRSVVLRQLHDFFGHQDVGRTTELIRSRIYWPTLTTDVAEHCRKCIRCRVAKEPTPKTKPYISHVKSCEATTYCTSGLHST